MRSANSLWTRAYPVLPLDHYPGNATAVQFLTGHRTQAIAEPVRLGGGSALVVHRSR